jgi:hypothetical protein
VTVALTPPITLLALWALRGRDIGVGFAFGIACVAAATFAGTLVGPRVGLVGAALGLVAWALACRWLKLTWLGGPGAPASGSPDGT